ncbi:MAG: hypothetical protein J6O61_09725, partial [Butyrivibrio sp.]|uniref:hypothetical protein n=1 Tax=Butyrivibrio sp. TaxID=28121 RepID=UPI001B1C3AFD
TLKPNPQTSPSNQPLKLNPQKLPLKKGLTLKSDPQKLWQTLKNFDYPPFRETRAAKLLGESPLPRKTKRTNSFELILLFRAEEGT